MIKTANVVISFNCIEVVEELSNFYMGLYKEKILLFLYLIIEVKIYSANVSSLNNLSLHMRPMVLKKCARYACDVKTIW